MARSNVCPEIAPPDTPSFYAFSYTRSGRGRRLCRCRQRGTRGETGGSYAERIVRLGEQSADAMREKARYVLGEMERRMTALGVGWARMLPRPSSIRSTTSIRFSPRRSSRAAPLRGRADLALRAAAGRRPRFRDGCARPRPRTGGFRRRRRAAGSRYEPGDRGGCLVAGWQSYEFGAGSLHRT